MGFGSKVTNHITNFFKREERPTPEFKRAQSEVESRRSSVVAAPQPKKGDETNRQPIAMGV